jgi:hypothetical protein
LDAAAAPRFAASTSTVLLLLLPISPSPLLPANPLSSRTKVAFFYFEGEEEVLKKEVVSCGPARRAMLLMLPLVRSFEVLPI